MVSGKLPGMALRGNCNFLKVRLLKTGSYTQYVLQFQFLLQILYFPEQHHYTSPTRITAMRDTTPNALPKPVDEHRLMQCPCVETVNTY